MEEIDSNIIALIDIFFLAKILIFFVLLGLSAFFSGSEVALFGLSNKEKDEIEEHKHAADRRLKKLVDNPKKTLITILTGNNAVNIAAASVAALLTRDVCDAYKLNHTAGLIIEVGVVTLLILILSEITPKIIALRNPLKISRWIAASISFVKSILSPFVWLFTLVINSFSKMMRVEQVKASYSVDELKILVEVSEERGELERAEREMIDSIFEFGETLAKEIMVPRTDMKMIELNSNIQEIIDSIKEWGFSRYPVYKEDRDTIVGLLYAKDLLPYLRGIKGEFDLKSLLRPAYFIPENKEIAQLLREFQKDKIHLAVVVDEYGGTAGLVTLEDILEEIVGEIQDEYDQELPLYIKEGPGVFIADAKMNIENVNEMLTEDVIPADGDFETLGGFIYDITGKIPSENEGIEFGDYMFYIQEVEGQRLKKIKIVKKDGPTDGD